MTILPIQASVTKTSTFDGAAIDVSGITGDWTLKLQVSALSNSASATPQVRFLFADSVNSFTASLAGPTFSFLGTLTSSADVVQSRKKQDFPDLRLGTASALLRLSLTAIGASSSVTYSAWLEY